MIEALYRRKHCRDFLKMYSEQLYKELIPDIFEIGVLTLLNSFNKYIFTKEEINDIILDLKNKEYIQNPEIKSLQKLPLTKPLTFSQEEEKQFRKYDGNFSKKEDEIYPNWWWNVKETRPRKNEEIQTIDYYPENYYQPFYNNNIYNNGYNSLMYSSPNLRSENYYNNYNNTFNNSYNGYYNNNLMNQGNYSNQRQMYEYPRRRMIMNKLSKGKKKRNKNKHQSNNYFQNNKEKEKNIQSNNQNLNNQENNNNQNIQRNQPIKKKVSYKISYDKELKPEKIEKSGKEIDPSYSYYQGNIQKTTSSNNNNNNNNYNNEMQNPQNNLVTSQNSNNNQLSSMNISDETRNAIQNNFRESTVSSNMNNQNYQNSQNNFNNSNNEYYNQQY
jgi:hypothetical protein